MKVNNNNCEPLREYKDFMTHNMNNAKQCHNVLYHTELVTKELSTNHITQIHTLNKITKYGDFANFNL